MILAALLICVIWFLYLALDDLLDLPTGVSEGIAICLSLIPLLWVLL